MRRSFVAAFLLLGAASVYSGPALSASTLGVLAGEYSQQCSDSAALRALVAKDSLSLRYGTKAVTGGALRETTAYFGNTPPPGFSRALLSTVPGAGKLAFVVYAPASGTELAIDAEPQVLERVGLLRLSALRFRKCR
jgi:hypothetical protein